MGPARESGPNGALARSAGIFNPENPHSLVSRVQVCLCLVAVRFGLLQVPLGNGMMLVQVLFAGLVLIGEPEGVGGLQISIQQLRVVRAAYIQHGLTGFYVLPGTTRIRLTGPPTWVMTVWC